MTERLAEEVIWDTRKAVPLKKFDNTTKTPCIVQLADVDKAKKLVLPTELNITQGLLLHSIITHKKVICQCADTKSDSGHKTRFSIPIGYNGLLEILSENGEAAPPFSSISEVADAAVEQFLIRSKVECLTEVTDCTSVRTLKKGTVLIAKGTAKVISKLGTESYLHCTDKNGFYVYLNYKTSGTFSQFAGPTSISGVHTVQSLVKCFRLPCIVRVVSGKIPRQACDDEKPGVFRLLQLRKERTALLAPLSAKQMVVPVPLKAELSFYRPANMQELSKHFIFNQILDTCTSKVQRYLTSMHVIVSSRDSPKVVKTKKQEEENSLFEDVDEIYPYIRRGGIPPRMMRAHSLDSETIVSGGRAIMYNRSRSQPAISSHERPRSQVISHLVKQHTISSPTTETTFQFQSTSDSLTLGKTNVLRQFIEKYTSKDSLSSQGHSVGSSDDIYFTLDCPDSTQKLSSIKDIISTENGTIGHRG